MEPEISHRITIGGWRSWGFLNFIEIPPPERNDARSVERISMRDPPSSWRNRRVGTFIIGSRSFAIACFACSTSSADMVSKSISCNTSLFEKVKLASNSTSSAAGSSLDLVATPRASDKRRLISSSSSSRSTLTIGNIAPIIRSIIRGLRQKI